MTARGCVLCLRYEPPLFNTNKAWIVLLLQSPISPYQDQDSKMLPIFTDEKFYHCVSKGSEQI